MELETYQGDKLATTVVDKEVRDVSSEYKVAAVKVLEQLEKSLGKDLDDKEKFMFVHGTADCKLPDKAEFTGKCPKKCAEARLEADEAIDDGRLKEGLKCLNQAVMLAPTEEHNMTLLAETLFQRSQLLLSLGHHESALRDASLAAIKQAFPSQQLFKLFSHQAKCQAALKCYFEAQKCYQRALSALDKTDLDQASRDAEKMLIQEALHSLKRDQVAVPGSSKNAELLHITKKHSKYPCLSQQVSIHYSQEKGRYALAASDIKPGTVLGVEDPIVSCLKEDCFSSRCLNCFEFVLAGLPCHDCSQVVFCSLECRRCAMSSFHKYECQNMHLLQPGPNYLALRAITQHDLQYFLKNRVSKFESYDDSSGTQLEGNKKYLSTDMKNLFNLSSKKADIEKKMERYMVSAYLLKILQAMNYFVNDKKNEASLTEEEVFIGMLLAHFVGVAENNSQIICRAPSDDTIKSLPDILKQEFEPQQIGFGINPTLAFINHSCRPNTIKIQTGKKTVIIAAESIPKGDEILDNYGCLFYTSGLARRQNDLGFPCNCRPCNEDWPKYQHLTDKVNDPSQLGASNNVAELLRRQLELGRAANAVMERINTDLSHGHVNRVLSSSFDYGRLLDKLVSHPHRFYFNNYMIIFYSYWRQYGNKDLA